MAGSTRYPQLATTCADILRTGTGVLTWAWDDYLGAALAVFPAGDNPTVAAILDKTLPQSWDVATVAAAPAPVTTQIKAMGGLRSGQRFFASPADQDAMLFAAWWPWGDGKKVSLRVGTCAGSGSPDAAALTAELRSWFGI